MLDVQVDRHYGALCAWDTSAVEKLASATAAVWQQDPLVRWRATRLAKKHAHFFDATPCSVHEGSTEKSPRHYALKHQPFLVTCLGWGHAPEKVTSHSRFRRYSMAAENSDSNDIIQKNRHEAGTKERGRTLE